ncbi:MAG: metallophosphoesterase family protein [Myxococcota bacterium]
MKRANWFTRIALLLGSAVLSGCPTGYRFVPVPGEPSLVTADLDNQLARLANEAETRCADGLRPLIHCERDPTLCTTNLLEHRVESCEKLRPLLSFVHLSDAQLKEELVSLDGPLSTESYDHIQSSFARNRELEQQDFAVLLATVLSINQLARSPEAQAAPGRNCARPLPPRFTLHTGDAIDAGMFSELFEFLGVTARLEMPFYNAVGNHDNLFFGAFPKARMQGLDVTFPFAPIGTTQRFIAAHNQEAYLYDISIPHVPLSSNEMTERGSAPAGLPDAPALATSFYHGFDLACGKRRNGARICAEARGYYGLDVPLPVSASGKPRTLRILVLNTAEVGPEEVIEGVARHSDAEMREDQYLWLEQELAAPRREQTLFLVAGHHSLDSFVPLQRDWLKKLLVDANNVLAYVDGHTHAGAIHPYERRGRAPLWEITAGSTLIYPQLAQLVELLEDNAAPANLYLRVRSFRQQLSDAPCAQGKACVELAARARVGRLGAYADRGHDRDFREEAPSVESQNGLLPLGVP